VWLPGKQRLARALVRPQRLSGDASIPLAGDLELRVPSLREPVAFHLLVDGVYEPLVAEYLAAALRAGSILIDVGANVGCFAVPLSRRVRPGGGVLAVEASPRVFPYLERNVKSNGCDNVWTVHAAAHERDGTADFYEAPSEKFGMGSMAPQFHTHPVTVPTRSLDSLAGELGLARVDALKVDVEGLEAVVRRGAEQLLRTFRPPVVFEFCDWAEERVTGTNRGDAQRVLLDLGYRIWDIITLRRGGLPLSAPQTSGSAILVGQYGS
jgi:FkbM family methyltransferase